MPTEEENIEKQRQVDDHDRAAFVSHPGWKVAKNQLIERIMAIDSSSQTLESELVKKTPMDEIMQKLYTNAMAANIVVTWINTIETLAGVHNADMMKETKERKEDQVIVKLPD